MFEKRRSIRFHKELYIGESVSHIKRVMRKLRCHAGQLGIYVIALSNGADQLEIYHCAFLQQSYYKKYPPCIVGIAGGYDEAVGLIQRMAADIYKKTGNYKLKEYFLDSI